MKSESWALRVVATIKKKCKERHIKVSELLRAAGASQHSIDDWEHERTEPSFPVLARICEVLEIEIGELFVDAMEPLTDAQVAFLKEWRKLSPDEKTALHSYIAAMQSNH